MFGSNYYGSVEYGSTRMTFTEKVKKAISNIVLGTKNIVASLLTVNKKAILETNNEKAQLVTNSEQGHLITKSDKIIL